MKRCGWWSTVVIFALLSLFFVADFAHAEKEQLNAYTIWSERYANAIFSAFTKDNGIKVNWMRFSSGEVQAGLRLKKQPQVDVVSAIWPKHS